MSSSMRIKYKRSRRTAALAMLILTINDYLTVLILFAIINK